MKKRKLGGNQNERNEFEQMSFFDLLENDVNINLGENNTREEQATLFDLENEQDTRGQVNTLDRRDQHTLQPSDERVDERISSDEIASSGIHTRSKSTNATIEGNNTRLDSSTQLDEERTLSRIRLNAEDDTRLSVDEKILGNIRAIQILSLLKYEDREATTEEQKTLSGFSGWGGCPQVFNENDNKYFKERSELKDLLSVDEYKNAKESTLTSFYTPLNIINHVYQVLNRLGFEKGSILETSLGTGNFIGMMPDEMFEQSDIYGIELDSISSEIASNLYQGASIINQGFENCPYPNNLFDLAISNVPFGTFQLHDKELNKYHFAIHNYFFAKALQKVRNGGLIAFITSSETMDGNNGIMDYINSRADFLGAIRLPNNVFMKNGANTQVTSDIIFLKRNDEKYVIDDDITTQRVDYTDHRKINKYFVENPNMVFGTIKEQTNQFGGYELTTTADDMTIEEHFEKVMDTFDSVYTEQSKVDNSSLYKQVGLEYSKYAPDSFFIENNILYYRDDEEYYEIKTSEQLKDIETKDTHIAFKNDKDIEKVKHMIGLVDKTIDLVDIQSRNIDETLYLARREELNADYDSFVKKYGALHKTTNMPLISCDPRAYVLHSLEDYNPKTKTIIKSAIFTERTINAKKEIKSVDTIQDGLAVSLDNRGKIDVGYIAVLSNKSEQQIKDELLNEKLAFIDPKSHELVLVDDYLSGNIKKKMDVAKAYGFDENFEALKNVLPERLSAEDIKAQLGSTWIPEKYVKEFVEQLFELGKWEKERLNINYDKILGTFVVENSYASGVVKGVWGVEKSDSITYPKRQPDYSGYDLLDDVLNSRIPTIRNYWTEYDHAKEREVTKSELNSERTTSARDLSDRLNEVWEDWIFSDYERKTHLENIYNDKFNSIRLQEYDGSYLSFPEMNALVSLEPYQKNAVARIMKGQNTLLWQQVGAGKTYEMIASGMEMKRLGISNKNLYIVPNHLLSQWEMDFLNLYPKSKLLVANKKDFAKDKRQVFINKIATGNYDAIIMAHSSFKFLSVSYELQVEHMEREINSLELAIEQIRSSEDSSTKRVKMLEKTKKSIENNVLKLTDTKRDENLIPFDKLGIDFLFVDESHEFKNLYTYTSMNNVAGLQTQHSQKASDMFMKVKIIEEQGGNVCFASGTPVTNTMAELYTVQRYLQESALKDMDIYCFDAWAKAFGKVVNSFEISIDGSRFVNRSRFCKFFNIQELMTQIKQVSEIQTAGMLRKELLKSTLGRKSAIPPTHIGGKPQVITIEPSEDLEDYIATIVERTEAIHDGGVNPSVDNMLKVTSDSKKASIDMRLIDPSYPDEENGKLNVIAKTIKSVYEDYTEQSASQLVFCDSSTPNGNYTDDTDVFTNVYDDIKKKLVSYGIPSEEIAFIHDFKTELSKIELFKKVNEGKVRVLFGSTKKLGAGTNVQERLIAIHHVDVPWKASDIEQQNGRGFRQGNMFDEIYEFRYVTKKSFDAYSWQMVETKSTYTTQLMEGTSSMREIDEDMQSVLNFAEVKAIATGNPIIKEKYEVDSEVKRLEGLKKQYLKRKYTAQEDRVRLPVKLRNTEERIRELEIREAAFKNEIYPESKIDELFTITINGRKYNKMKDAWDIITENVNKHDFRNGSLTVAQFLGQDLIVEKKFMNDLYISTPCGNVKIDECNVVGRVNFVRVLKEVNNFSQSLKEELDNKVRVLKDMEVAETNCNSSFEYEDKYQELRQRQKEINKQLEESGKDVFMQEEVNDLSDNELEMESDNEEYEMQM